MIVCCITIRWGEQPINGFFIDLFEKQTLFQSVIKRNKGISTQGLVTETKGKSKSKSNPNDIHRFSPVLKNPCIPYQQDKTMLG